MMTIFLSNMKRKLKSPLVFVNYLLLPLLLIVILGNALSLVFEDSDTSKQENITKVKTVVVNEDSGKIGKNILAFLTSDDNKKMLDIKIENDLRTAKNLLKNNHYEQIIYMPKNLSNVYSENKESKITVYGKDNNIDKINVTGLTLSAYGDGYLVMDKLSKGKNPPKAGHVYSDLLKNGEKVHSGKKSDSISALSYYGVTMLVLILVYGISNTMNFIQEEYDEALGDRHMVSPVSKLHLILGQLLTGVAISIVQGIMLVLCAKLFFKVSYGDNLAVVFLIIVIGSIFFNSLGLILGVFSRSFKQLDSIVSILIPVMTFIGGGFIKLDFGPLKHLSINEVFQGPLFDYIQQGVITLTPVYIALLLAVCMVGVSVMLLTQQGGKKSANL
ncbi:ABC-2 type transport system permease protein [Bacillus sp. OV322]|uniref:ABC transporter permease n=1 Tax=Bacillus sp. OV322 TaxID=1882764 RepID=UPI0008EE7ED9|nr:ABC-2 type transport system permease protein [Bacillus sp. OV322]